MENCNDEKEEEDATFHTIVRWATEPGAREKRARGKSNVRSREVTVDK